MSSFIFKNEIDSLYREAKQTFIKKLNLALEDAGLIIKSSNFSEDLSFQFDTMVAEYNGLQFRITFSISGGTIYVLPISTKYDSFSATKISSITTGIEKIIKKAKDKE